MQAISIGSTVEIVRQWQPQTFQIVAGNAQAPHHMPAASTLGRALLGKASNQEVLVPFADHVERVHIRRVF